MTRIFVTMMLVVVAVCGFANDSEYFSAGNQLVPVQSTQISVAKEILTINLTNDGITHVDVYYEFRNDGPATDIVMGFEALPPYFPHLETHGNAAHPNISNFKVEMNGAKLPYKNAISETGLHQGIRPVDFTKWKADPDGCGSLVNKTNDTLYLDYSYVYYFNAHFRPGINVVHHTYAYKESCGVNRTFWIDYKLTPATRWANNRIEDFTLRITANGVWKHFAMDAAPFEGANVAMDVKRGKAKCRELLMDYEHEKANARHFYELAMRDATVEWHATNFHPQAELMLSSADCMVMAQQWLNYRTPTGEPFAEAIFYDAGVNFSLTTDGKLSGDNALNRRIVRNLPFAARGYQFKDAQLRKFFLSQWWYMPNPAYNPGADRTITSREQEIVKGMFNDFVP